nr:hypothetical protein [Tanacetum cinerariifolium]
MCVPPIGSRTSSRMCVHPTTIIQHSQPAQKTVPRHEIKEVEIKAQAEAHGTDRALEANVDCFINLKRSNWLRAVVLGAINGCPITIDVPTTIVAAQQAPPTMVWTDPIDQDALVQTQNASIDEAQQAATPTLSSVSYFRMVRGDVRVDIGLQKIRDGLAPPLPSPNHFVISVRPVTINVTTSIVAAQQAPSTVVWTGPTGQDALVQTQDASVDEA